MSNKVKENDNEWEKVYNNRGAFYANGTDITIDIILGGHSHLNKLGESDNEIPYMEPASYGKAYN